MRTYVFTISRVALCQLLFAAVTMLTSSVAEAQRQKPPKGLPKGPTVTLERVRPDVAELKAIPSGPGFLLGSLMEYEFIGGPNTSGSTSFLSYGPLFQVGIRDFRRNTYPVLLQPNTEYQVRVRYIKTSIDFSEWTTFSFRTASQFLARPSSPLNLRESSRTATRVTLVWEAPSTGANVSYEYYINGVKTPLTRCGGAYVICTEADFRTVTFALPSAGTSLRFGVSARDADLNLSLPNEILVAN